MTLSPTEITLALNPESRIDIINVSESVIRENEDFFSSFRKSLFCSYHTTAGYFEQAFCNRLNNNPDALQAYVGTFRRLFPPEANYQHDQMELREELSSAQKQVEPRNADSHLTYIGSGLENCVTYKNNPDSPVFFVDLDGLNGNIRRLRKTTVIGYNSESVAAREPLEVKMSAHPIDSVNLWDPKLGVIQMLEDRVQELGIQKGRIELTLDASERNTGLTVNEYETLLMQHDLVDVLHNPIRFMAQKGRNMLRDPRAIKEKAKDYAKYDLVHVVNEFIEAMGLSESLIERIIDKFLAVPAARFLRMKRSVSLVVSDDVEPGSSRIITGTYQSPILVQWQKAVEGKRSLNITFTRFA
ncbi:MAG: hypothetical protein IH853_11170 [Bacteroidetes bacterium]|nr:hypothetical protein [Bacteroidota bacterium]MCH8246511.1 hypothetical protein [Bacteroidota bacterium]